MKTNINEDNLNRLAIGIIQKYKCSYEQALEKLQSFKLNLVCGDKICNSPSLQTALLTAVNSGRRAFLGGIYVSMPKNVACLVPWPNNPTLNKIVKELGGEISTESPDANFTLTFGLPADIDNNELEIICNAWQGGVISSPSEGNLIPENESMNLGGILAGALGVGMSFLKVSGIDITAGDNPTGLSLWRPDLHWLDKDAQGPVVKYLPKKYWILGLGHLGQAYLWNIGLLGYQNTSDVQIINQDFDKITDGNYSSGLLCEENNVGKYKTRVCTEWLEDRGFQAKISERKFDEHTMRVDEEPFLALCGFDNAKARSFLEGRGFDLIIEAALGDSLSNFDRVTLHTFPEASKTPSQLWGNHSDEKEISAPVYDAFKDEKEECGILALTLAKKALSASFVGAFTGALVIAESIRGVHSGFRYEMFVGSLRSLGNKKAIFMKEYDIELARNGSISLNYEIKKNTTFQKQ